jgi:uncharacterized protein YaeQ
MHGKQKLSDEACKLIIRRLAKRYNIDAKDIVTKLMSEDDKQDMREGNLPYNVLVLYIEVWIEMGMPNQNRAH